MNSYRHIDVLDSQEKAVRNNIVAAKNELIKLKEEIEQVKKQLADYKASKQLPATEKNCKELMKKFINDRKPFLGSEVTLTYTDPMPGVIWSTTTAAVNE